MALIIGLLFLFLNARTAFWVAMGIPAALIATIGIMYIAGLTINMISLFAFIGAQKHGKFVRDLLEPPKEATIEEQVLAQTTEAKISVGPTGPPAPGPTGPPAPGPSGPPSAVPVESDEPALQEEPAIETESPGDVYEDQGDGWYFRKFADGTYDQTVYSMHEGQYIPYQPPDA